LGDNNSEWGWLEPGRERNIFVSRDLQEK